MEKGWDPFSKRLIEDVHHRDPEQQRDVEPDDPDQQARQPC